MGKRAKKGRRVGENNMGKEGGGQTAGERGEMEQERERE